MFEVFSATLSAMLTMFFCIFVGFILRKKKLEPEDTDPEPQYLGNGFGNPGRLAESESLHPGISLYRS